MFIIIKEAVVVVGEKKYWVKDAALNIFNIVEILSLNTPKVFPELDQKHGHPLAAESHPTRIIVISDDFKYQYFIRDSFADFMKELKKQLRDH